MSGRRLPLPAGADKRHGYTEEARRVYAKAS